MNCNKLDQLNIFDFIENDKFCFDDDINHIVELIEKLMQPYMDDRTFTELWKKKFDIWEDGEKYGYRLSMIYIYNDDIECDYFKYYEKNPLYMKKINELNLDELFEYSEKHNIDLSIHPTPFMVCIYTRFLDKRKNLR